MPQGDTFAVLVCFCNSIPFLSVSRKKSKDWISYRIKSCTWSVIYGWFTSHWNSPPFESNYDCKYVGHFCELDSIRRTKGTSNLKSMPSGEITFFVIFEKVVFDCH